jgi:metal-dependent amidase/aminoacylase/carboxypeptidase family protein
MADMVMRTTALNTPDGVVSIGRIIADGATNVIPDEVRLEGTMRIFSERDRETLHQTLRTLCDRLGAEEGLEIGLSISAGYPAVENHPELTLRAKELAREAGYTTRELALRPTSEDFGRYGLHYPSLFYRIGVGAASGRPHTSRFNPDERAIPAGVDLMARLALHFLGNK